MNILTVKTDWTQVYSVEEVKENLWTENIFPELKTGTTFYRTGGGGETTGFFVKTSDKPEDAWCCGVYRVRRPLYRGWEWELLKNRTLEYEPEDEMNGKTARCRLVKQIDVSETRKIIDENSLWGNAIEIVKALRDGADPKVDASYKDLCLGIVLYHFQELDKYLGLLPADSCPRYKEVLHSLKSEETYNDSEEDSDSESSESEDSDTESEDSDSDPLWNEIPDYAWDYTNANWISELYKIKEDKQKSVTERVELMMARIAFFEDEIASRKVAEDEQRERDEEQE